MNEESALIPQIPLAEWMDSFIDWLDTILSPVTELISDVFRAGFRGITDALLWVPTPIMILIFVGLTYLATRRIGLSIGTFLAFLLLWNLDLWGATMQTFTLVTIATFIAILWGVPLGILAALKPKFQRFIKPLLDFMQTMPAFVYLIPAISFFGIGATSGIFATVIFSIPPAIRLTILGIQQIDKELIEASDSFGSTTMQKLLKVQIPLALPTIMAGVNQTIMLALSMMVIAGMIGAQGLGTEVYGAVELLKPGEAFEAGLAIVILAIVLDRVTQGLSKLSAKKKKD
jgi:glycine betaine/proline transport system permease protein